MTESDDGATYLGVDLVWSDCGRSGVYALDGAGQILDVAQIGPSKL